MGTGSRAGRPLLEGEGVDRRALQPTGQDHAADLLGIRPVFQNPVARTGLGQFPRKHRARRLRRDLPGIAAARGRGVLEAAAIPQNLLQLVALGRRAAAFPGVDRLGGPVAGFGTSRCRCGTYLEGAQIVADGGLGRANPLGHLPRGQARRRQGRDLAAPLGHVGLAARALGQPGRDNLPRPPGQRRVDQRTFLCGDPVAHAPALTRCQRACTSRSGRPQTSANRAKSR
jgi:hypothetical protein